MEQNRVAAYYPNNVTTDHIQQEPSKAAIADSQVHCETVNKFIPEVVQGGSGALAAAWFPDFVSVSSGEAMHGGGRAIAGGRKLDVGSAVGSPEDRETADDGN
ncbi:hypothetical protein V6N13_139769 [Hibiscus sabdariffa]